MGGRQSEEHAKGRFERTCNHLRRSAGGRKVHGERITKEIWQASLQCVGVPVVARGEGESVQRTGVDSPSLTRRSAPTIIRVPVKTNNEISLVLDASPLPCH